MMGTGRRGQAAPPFNQTLLSNWEGGHEQASPSPTHWSTVPHSGASAALRLQGTKGEAPRRRASGRGHTPGVAEPRGAPPASSAPTLGTRAHPQLKDVALQAPMALQPPPGPPDVASRGHRDQMRRSLGPGVSTRPLGVPPAPLAKPSWSAALCSHTK